MFLELAVTFTHLQGSTDNRGSFKAVAIDSLSAALSELTLQLWVTANRISHIGHVPCNYRWTRDNKDIATY